MSEATGKKGQISRVAMPEQEAKVRARNFLEVPTGYTVKMAQEEASRCLQCKKPGCVEGCPVGVDIPGFIDLIAQGDFTAAIRNLWRKNALPAVCGRVCPQESQCEGKCIVGKKGQPVAIGNLERFCADYERENGTGELPPKAPSTGKRVAVVGSGPSGLTVAGDLIVKGHEVTIFEAFHKPGGVLVYGIPEFRLPKAIVAQEVNFLERLGVKVQCNAVVGRTVSLDELFAEGYDAIYVGVGAGLPKFMNIPGENLVGILSANEYLTRANLMRAYDKDKAHTPIYPSRKVAVLGGGNVAMDVARELMRDADDLKSRTDIPDNVYEGIKANKARELHLLIRRGVAQAKFSVQELRELEKLPGVQLIIDEDDFDLDDETVEAAGRDKLTRQMVEELFAIREMAEDMEDDGDVDFEGNPADRKYFLHFNTAPVEIVGKDGAVCAIRVERTVTRADGTMTRTGEFRDIPVQAVYHAVGYKPAAAPGIAYDGRRTTLANSEGRILTEASENGSVRPRLYSTGWAKRGPVGLIGSTKSDALAIVTHMLEDLAAAADGGRIAPDRDPESVDRLLADRGVRPIDFAGWKRIDAFERSEGAREGREHKKVIDPDRMRELARS